MTTKSSNMTVNIEKGRGYHNCSDAAVVALMEHAWGSRENSHTQSCTICTAWLFSAACLGNRSEASYIQFLQTWSWQPSSSGQHSRCTRHFIFLPIIALSTGMKERNKTCPITTSPVSQLLILVQEWKIFFFLPLQWIPSYISSS